MASTKVVEVPKMSKPMREYFRNLNQIVDDLFNDASDKQWEWTELASRAGLQYKTVYNLGKRITQYPQFLTVHKIAKALGKTVMVANIKIPLKKVG